jgi:hypothetical protein
MPYWIELLVYIFISIVFASLIFSTTSLLFRNKSLMMKWAQSEIDNAALREKLAELVDRGDYKKIEHTEGFVRFISESRDWAFEYIENVQSSLQELSEVVDSLKPGYLTAKDAEVLKENISKVLKHLPND